MKKFKITYSNNGDRCTLGRSVMELFAPDESEARWLCEQSKKLTDHFKIYGVKEL